MIKKILVAAFLIAALCGLAAAQFGYGGFGRRFRGYGFGRGFGYGGYGPGFYGGYGPYGRGFYAGYGPLFYG